MLNIKKILLPTDFSECAEDAFTVTSVLARRIGAEVHIVHAIVQSWQDSTTLPLDLPLDENDVATQLRNFAKREADGNGTERGFSTVTAYVHSTSPVRAILEYEREQDIDLIAMSTHGRCGVERLLMGSITEDIVRHSTCPVFTVHSGLHGRFEKRIERILVPVDFSEYAQLTLTYARELAAAYDAHVDVLHVLEETVLPHVYGMEPVALAIPDLEVRTEDALEDLTRAVELSDGARVPFELHVVIGHPSVDIVRFASEHRSDLIVLATHGRSGISRLLLGSVTEKIMRLAPCPVFTIKSFGKSLVQSTAVSDSSIRS